MRRPHKRRKSSKKAWDDLDGARLSLKAATQRRDQRHARLTRTGRIAATGLCGLLALGGLAAGANALLSATTDIPFVLKPPHTRQAPTAQTSTDALRARLLRVPANSLGPSLPVPIFGSRRPGEAIPYVEGPDLCIVVSPRPRRRTRRLPASSTYWNCYSQRNLALAIKRRGADAVYFAYTPGPLVVGIAGPSVSQVTVRGPNRVMPAKLTVPWRAGIPGARSIRLWAAYPLSLLDRIRTSSSRYVRLSKLRVTATTRDGVTRRVPFP